MRMLGPLVALLAIAASIFYLYEGRKQYENTAADETNYPSSVRSALSEAQAKNKKVLVMVTATWCGACQYMKKDVFPDAKVQALAGKFVWVFLDADDPSNEAFQREFGVEYFPTFLILNDKGRKVDEFNSCDADDFAGELAAYQEEGRTGG